MKIANTLKVLNFAGIMFRFAIFDHFCKILYPLKAPNPQNHKIKYL